MFNPLTAISNALHNVAANAQWSISTQAAYKKETKKAVEEPQAVLTPEGFRHRDGKGSNEAVKISWKGTDGKIHYGTGRRVSTPWGVHIATTSHILGGNVLREVLAEYNEVKDVPEIRILSGRKFDIQNAIELPLLIKESFLTSHYNVERLPDVAGFPIGLPKVSYNHKRDFPYLSWCGSTTGLHTTLKDFDSIFDRKPGDSGSAFIRPTRTAGGPAYVLTHILFAGDIHASEAKSTLAWEIVPVINDGKLTGYTSIPVMFSKEKIDDSRVSVTRTELHPRKADLSDILDRLSDLLDRMGS